MPAHPEMSGGSPARFGAAALRLATHLHTGVQNMNTSKIFAGLMIITLNVASKFVTIKLSKTMEAYLKFSFSRDALIFAIAWVGSRDIYVALAITALFVLCMDFLCNEESAYCVFPEAFCDYHIGLLDGAASDDAPIPPEDLTKAHALVERAERQARGSGESAPPAAAPLLAATSAFGSGSAPYQSGGASGL